MSDALDIGHGISDPARRGRAARQPLRRAGRPAREQDRLADRGDLRRPRLRRPQPTPRRRASRAGSGRASPPSPRTRAARRATARSRWSGFDRASPARVAPRKQRRATRPGRAAKERRLSSQAAAVGAQAAHRRRPLEGDRRDAGSGRCRRPEPVGRSSSAVLQGALDGRVERVDPRQRQRLGRGEAGSRSPRPARGLGAVVAEHAVQQREPTRAARGRRRRAR